MKNKYIIPPVVLTSKGNIDRTIKHGGKSIRIAAKSPSSTHVDQAEHADSNFPGFWCGIAAERVPFAALVSIEENTALRVEGRLIPVPPSYILIFRGDVVHQGIEFPLANRRIHMYVDSKEGMLGRDMIKGRRDKTFFPAVPGRYECEDGRVFRTFKGLKQHYDRNHKEDYEGIDNGSGIKVEGRVEINHMDDNGHDNGIAIGGRVEILDAEKWWPATIVFVRKNGNVNVVWDVDGSESIDVNLKKVRLIGGERKHAEVQDNNGIDNGIALGGRVEVKDANKWWPATIVFVRKNGNVNVVWDVDGSESIDVNLRKVRLIGGA
ncbi:hypothetical protein TrCOL_g3043 [Triparma columacea]|uniref:Uncharacterized protein n=1 Tax=Triparma columacea TaxID=722753 RepID=A0A9W7L3M0_9STRA|nr:hypothetical protein TrCOL_g3043 [Triparma columacea]